MGRYEYDAASPPSMVISDFKFSGACTNPEEVENGKSEDDSAGSISTETAEDSVGASESGDLSLGFSGSGNLGSGGAVITGDVSGTPTSIGGVSSVSSQAGGSATPTKGKDCDVSGVPVKGSQPAATDYNPGFVAGPTATNSDEAPPKPQKTGDDSNDDGEIEEGTGSSGSGSLKGGCGCDNDSPSSGGDSDEEQDDSPDGSDTGTASEDATSSLGDSAIGSGEDVSGEDDSGSEVASPSLTASSGFSSVVASKGSVSEGTEPEVSSDNAEPSTLDVVIPDSSSSKMSSSMALVVFSALAIYFRV